MIASGWRHGDGRRAQATSQAEASEPARRRCPGRPLSCAHRPRSAGCISPPWAALRHLAGWPRSRLPPLPASLARGVVSICKAAAQLALRSRMHFVRASSWPVAYQYRIIMLQYRAVTRQPATLASRRSTIYATALTTTFCTGTSILDFTHYPPSPRPPEE